MTNNILSWTKQDWINKIKEADAGFVGCFLPSLSLSFLHNLPVQAEQYRSFKRYVNTLSTLEIEAILESIGLSVLYSTDATVKALNYVATGHDDQPTLEQQFLDKDRNIFIIDISDSNYVYQTLTFVCEYSDPSDPLADHTVDYDAVKQRNDMRESFSGLMAKMRKNRSDDDSDFNDLF